MRVPLPDDDPDVPSLADLDPSMLSQLGTVNYTPSVPNRPSGGPPSSLLAELGPIPNSPPPRPPAPSANAFFDSPPVPQRNVASGYSPVNTPPLPKRESKPSPFQAQVN